MVRIQERLLALARMGCTFIVAMSCVVLLGWTLGLPALVRAAPGMVAMNPLTAVALLMAGISLHCSTPAALPGTRRSRLGQILGLTIALVGALKLAEFLGADFGLDQIPGSLAGNELAPNTALNFLFCGLALSLLDYETRVGLRPAQPLFLLAGLVSMLALIGYAYRVLSLYRVGSAMPMALTTAISFTVLSLSGLAARPDSGILRLITSSTAGGKMARRLLPLAILVPWVLGGLRLLEEEIGVYQTEFGVSIFAAGSTVVFTVFIWWNAGLLYRADLEQAATARRLNVQYESARLLAESGPLSEGMSKILRTICETLGCHLGALWAIDPQSQKLRCVELWYVELPGLSEFAHATREAAFQTGEDLPGRVWATGRSVFVPELASEPALQRAAQASRAKLESGHGFPIWQGNELLGVLEFYCRDQTPPGRDALEMLAAVSSQVGLRMERDRAGEQLRAATANLERSNTELQQFASLASHDLSEPLRMVISYLDLLRTVEKGHLKPESMEFIGFAVDGAHRMQRLITDLLAYSRVDSSGRSLVPTDLEQALAGALANLKVAIEESGVTIVHAPLPTVQGDAIQLTQVFQNLIGNAIKFRGNEPARIEINAVRREAEWVLSVRDNGIGIDPRNYERIFVIFQRLHTRQEYPGTGMGLAICKRIIERHGGKLWVESKPGQGATFSFTLQGATDRKE
jgi:signal transduction histidine kinase